MGMWTLNGNVNVKWECGPLDRWGCASPGASSLNSLDMDGYLFKTNIYTPLSVTGLIIDL